MQNEMDHRVDLNIDDIDVDFYFVHSVEANKQNEQQ